MCLSHSEIEAADHTCHLTWSQDTDTGPISRGTAPITLGARQDSQYSSNGPDRTASTVPMDQTDRTASTVPMDQTDRTASTVPMDQTDRADLQTQLSHSPLKKQALKDNNKKTTTSTSSPDNTPSFCPPPQTTRADRLPLEPTVLLKLRKKHPTITLHLNFELDHPSTRTLP